MMRNKPALQRGTSSTQGKYGTLLYFLPLTLAGLLLITNIQEYRIELKLLKNLISMETQKTGEEIVLRLETALIERINDLNILASLWPERPPQIRVSRFISDAERIIRNEPSYHVINYVDENSIIRYSAPLGKQPELIDLDLSSLPGRKELHDKVRQTGKPLMSPPIILTNGDPGIVIWHPIFSNYSTEHTFQGMAAGTILTNTIVGKCISNTALSHYFVEILAGGVSIYFSGVPAKAHKNTPAAYTHEFHLLGETWSVSVSELKDSPHMVMLYKSGERLLLDLILSFLAASFLAAAIYGLNRVRKSRITIRENEIRLELALKGADLGLWDWHIPSGSVVFNDRWQEMIGYTPGDLKPHIDTWKKLLHPADMERVMDALERHFKGETAIYETEHRLLSKKGDWIWVLDRGMAVEYDAKGAPVRAAGTHMDITARKSIEERLLQSLKEKDVLFKEVHHRVKNNLQIIMSLLSLQEGAITDSQGKRALSESRNRVMSMALIHEKLYQSENIGNIKVDDYLKSLLDMLSLSFAMDKKIGQEVDTGGLTLPLDTAVPLGLIVNELITNSVKYAFSGSSSGEKKISITLTKGPDAYTLTIADNGIGLSSGYDIEQAQTLGFQLVTALCRQINGKLTAENAGPGLRITITFR